MKILMIGLVWPEPKATGASLRMMEHIRLFQAQGWSVTFSCPAALNDAANALLAYDINVQEITLNSRTFDTFIQGLEPNIVLFDRFMMEEQFGWRVAETCPGAMRILETIDLHCLREARHQALKTGRTFTNQDLFNDTALREIASIYRSDLSIIISNFEYELLQTQFNISKAMLHLCPFMLAPTNPDCTSPSFEQRQHFMTIGNFRHAPNWDAILWLNQELWPLIRGQFPQAELHIYGAYTPPKATALHNPKEGFIIKGKANDAQEVLQASRVCLAPLRFGAGIKTKLADAMQAGTPSVTTSIGAEGMTGNLNWSGFVENEPRRFADAAVKLYQDKDIWGKSQNNGFEIVRSLFNQKPNSEVLLQRILSVKDNLVQHRKQNFVGAMLNHHHHRSTEFMSRWIEAKNKNENI